MIKVKRRSRWHKVTCRYPKCGTEFRTKAYNAKWCHTHRDPRTRTILPHVKVLQIPDVVAQLEERYEEEKEEQVTPDIVIPFRPEGTRNYVACAECGAPAGVDTDEDYLLCPRCRL